MSIESIIWKNMTLLSDPEGSDESDESDDHDSKPAVHFDDLKWHVILGICLVSIGLLIVILCITWSCVRKYCCSSLPTKIGHIKVIVRQPSIVSLGDDISNQRTWVTGTNISQLDESHPSIFQVLPSLHNPNAKDTTQKPPENPPSYDEAQAMKRKRLEKFLNV